MSNDIKVDENKYEIILDEKDRQNELKPVETKKEKTKTEGTKKDEIKINLEKKEEEIKVNTNKEDEIVKNEEKKDGIKNLDKPFYTDDAKTIYKINNTPLIKEISLLKTKNNPPTRAYLTVDYSSKNNSFICIGGSDQSCDQYNIINEYHQKDNIWKYWNNEEQSELGLELSGHTSNLITFGKNEYIYIFGGYDNWKKDFTAQSYLIDISKKYFQKINYTEPKEGITELPLPRSYHTSNYDKEKQIVYIYGGTDMNINHSKNNNFQSVWAFHLSKKYWKKIEIPNNNLQGAPRGHSSILLKDKLYIFGGVILFKKFQNKLYTIDLKGKKVENVDFENNQSVIPKPMAFHSSILLDNEKFLIHGGLDKNYNTINDIYIYYFNQKKFDKITIPLIPNLFGHKIVMNNTKNKLYIIGGMDNFKYVGDENLIYQIDEDGELLFNKTEEQIEFKPMLNISEILLNKEEENVEENLKDNENKVNRLIVKNKKWKKMFYISNK